MMLYLVDCMDKSHWLARCSWEDVLEWGSRFHCVFSVKKQV